MKHFWAELRPKLRNKLSEFEAMIVAPNTEEVLAQIELRFPGSTRRRRLIGDPDAFVLRSGPTLRVFVRRREDERAAFLRLFLDEAEVRDNPNAGAVVAEQVSK